jgi:hypothetical protein
MTTLPRDTLYDAQAERAVIGSLLIEPTAFSAVVNVVQPGDFHDESCRYAFEGALQLGRDGAAIDPLTLEAELTRRGHWAETGLSFLRECQIVDSALHAGSYAAAVAGLARRRKAVDLSTILAKAALSSDGLFDAELALTAATLTALSKSPQQNANKMLSLVTADYLLETKMVTPTFAIPGILPVGLTILAGRPKVGKSWLALQFALSVASGGMALGQKVQAGPVMYLALEDSPARLQDRMRRQGWTRGLQADFMTLGKFADEIGDLKNGGGEILARQIEKRGYRLVVIDTLSRAVGGDQNDTQAMTAGLTPLQELSHTQKCSMLMVDHHKKRGAFDDDVISDVLGSTAKSAMADTVLGLYKTPGVLGAKLSIIGREVEQQNLAIKFDFATGAWQLEGDVDAMAVLDSQQAILDALTALVTAGVNEIARAVGRDRGNTHGVLCDMVNAGLIARHATNKAVTYSLL